MSHAPLPAPTGPAKSTLNKKFKSRKDNGEENGPFAGLLFQEVSRDESRITLKFHADAIGTVPLSDYLQWTVIDVEV